MKTSTFTFVLAALLGPVAFSQAPVIEPLEFLPANPSNLDSIYIITNVSTQDNGVYLGNDVFHIGSTIRIEGCYFNDSETSTTNSYSDTINIGLKAAGTYEILYEAYRSGHDMICNEHLDSSQVGARLTVGFLSVSETTRDNFTIFPNPVTNGLIYVESSTSDIINFKLYNLAGEVVLQGIPGPSGAINVGSFRGIFFLGVYSGDMVMNRKIIIM